MLLPITLPTAMSAFCARVACRLTAICGALLPRATMVRPIISGRTCNRAARRRRRDHQLGAGDQQDQAAEQFDQADQGDIG